MALKSYESLVRTKRIGYCTLCNKELWSHKPVRWVQGKPICAHHPVTVNR